MSHNPQKNSTTPILRTIKCHLSASEDTLRQVWLEMTRKNTPLIVQLLKRVSEQTEFATNQENGTITKAEITKLRKSLVEELGLEKQSSRLYESADSLVQEIYSSWLSLYQKIKRRRDGKEYFLNHILKSDAELVQESNSDLPTIRSRAKEILANPEVILNKTIAEYQKSTKKNESKTLNHTLYEIQTNTSDKLTKCATAYLIKKHKKVSDDEEDITKLKQRRTQKEIEIKRLDKQLKENSLPRGRDITEQTYLKALDNLVNQVPQDNEEFADWLAELSRNSSCLPYPIDYLYSDLSWYKNDAGDICVYFKGWAKYHFKICCNKRQRHFFERFLHDYVTFKDSEKSVEKLSGSLFTLRSVQLLWQECKGKDKPWKVHKLALHCTYDLRLWTAEGTEQVRTQKLEKVQKKVNFSVWQV